MPVDPKRKSRGKKRVSEQDARIEAIRAKRKTDPARIVEAEHRAALEHEYRVEGAVRLTADGTTMGDLVTLRRFVMSLRNERERIGLSLNDLAESAKIDKAALSRLETGQQLNPTVNTLARYARALGKELTFALSTPQTDEREDAICERVLEETRKARRN
jgi:ribosome-binding protein aMBF1 (putative translation factor)